MAGERGWELLLGRDIERNAQRNDEQRKEQPSTHWRSSPELIRMEKAN
jgi:hypothetical protein